VLPAGLVPLAEHQLRRAGYQVTVATRGDPDPLLRPCEQLLAAARGAGKEFLAGIAARPRGLIEVRSDADVVRLTGLVCRLFPRARTLVAGNACGVMRSVKQFRRRLEKAVGGPVTTPDLCPLPGEGCCVVCGLGRLDEATRAGCFDVAVFPVARDLAAFGHEPALVRLGRHRVYGFIPAGLWPGAAAGLWLQALFGPVVYRVPDPAGERALVTVFWCRPPRRPPPGRVSPLKRDRLAYSGNQQRNEVVAAVAAAFRAGDRQKLADGGLLFGDGDLDEALGAGLPAVAVLVESAAHGRRLRRLLPGWALLDVPAAGPQAAPGTVTSRRFLPDSSIPSQWFAAFDSFRSSTTGSFR
jgi:hypothetical protein